VVTKRNKVDFISGIRQAWMSLKPKLHSLSALVQRGRWLYRTADEREWNPWLDETFHVHETAGSARQLLPLVDEPIPQRAELHVLPQSQEILLRVPSIRASHKIRERRTSSHLLPEVVAPR
jgi:hypothetical protein